jgi:hypothetical protein
MTGLLKRWRPVVEQEIRSGGYPWPADLVLSVIKNESGGKLGTVSSAGAAGLMQVMPKTLEDYNRRTKSNVPFSALRSKDPKAGPIQIRVGMNVLGRYWRRAAQWLRSVNGAGADIPLEDLARYAQQFYVMGPARVMKRAPKARPLRWRHWVDKFPDSKSTAYVNRIWDRTVSKNPAWNLAAVDKWIGAPSPDLPIIPPPPEAKKVEGFLIALLIIAIGWYLIQSKGKPAPAS